MLQFLLVWRVFETALTRRCIQPTDLTRRCPRTTAYTVSCTPTSRSLQTLCSI